MSAALNPLSSTILAIALKNGKHPYQRIVFDGEYIGYEDTDNKQQNLLAHTVQQVPEQCSYCFLFQ